MTFRRLTLSTIAAGILGLAALPASASAAVVAGPSPVKFPEREAGSTSDPQTVTISIVCSNFRPDLNPVQPCLTQDTFTRNPQFFGDHPGDFFAQGGTCPASLTNTNQPVLQCTILLRFKPTAAGQRKANFLAGTSNTGGPNVVVVQGDATPKPGTSTTKKKKCKKKGKKKKKCKKKKK